MDRSQCKNKFESKILFHHGEIQFWCQNSWKYYRYSWNDTQKLLKTQQTYGLWWAILRISLQNDSSKWHRKNSIHCFWKNANTNSCLLMLRLEEKTNGDLKSQLSFLRFWSQFFHDGDNTYWGRGCLRNLTSLSLEPGISCH